MVKDNPITDNQKKYPKTIKRELEKLNTVDIRIEPKHSWSSLNITLLPTTEQGKREPNPPTTLKKGLSKHKQIWKKKLRKIIGQIEEIRPKEGKKIPNCKTLNQKFSTPDKQKKNPKK